MPRRGAPKSNENASKWGLTSRNPLHKVVVRGTVTMPELAQYASDLAAAALWIAEEIDAEGAVPRMVGLYATVAAELEQVAAELAGRTGIKPAPLGEISDEAYERLRDQQAKALSLLLSQCTTAWKRLEGVVLVMGGTREDGSRKAALVDMDGDPVPVLNYLAGFLRSAKRLLRDMAANIAWRERGETNVDDLAAAIIRELKKGREYEDVVQARVERPEAPTDTPTTDVSGANLGGSDDGDESE